MKDLEKRTENLTHQSIMNLIMEDLNKIDKKYLELNYGFSKAECTSALSDSIVNTCENLGLRIVREEKFKLPESIRVSRKQNCCNVDFYIINPNGKDIIIELDSALKKWSYQKLEYFSEDYNAAWIVWKRGRGNLNYSNFFEKSRNKESDFSNENVLFFKHIIDLSKKP